MGLYNKFGYTYDQLICEDTALPNAGAAALTNDIEIKSRQGENLIIKVFAASTTVELAGGNSLTFRPLIADTVANLTAAPTTLPATIITQGVQSDVSWSAGEFICSFIIPKELIGTNNYLRINAVTTADESADKIEAFSFTTN